MGYRILRSLIVILVVVVLAILWVDSEERDRRSREFDKQMADVSHRARR